MVCESVVAPGVVLRGVPAVSGDELVYGNAKADYTVYPFDLSWLNYLAEIQR